MLNILENVNLPIDKPGVEMKYSSDFSSRKFQLFECSPALTDKILKDNEKLVIKNFECGDLKQMAAVSTSNETFKIKKCENTSQMFVVGQDDVSSTQVQIENMTQIHIELSPSKTKIYQILAVLENHIYDPNSE